MKSFLTFILVFGSLPSFGQSVSDQVVTINPYLTLQHYEHFKRLTLSSSDSPIEFLDGFKFEWGYSYRLSVKETKLNEALSDGTQYEYSLNHIVSKTKIAESTTFTLFLDPFRYYHTVDSSEQDMNQTLTQLNDSTYLYFSEVEIEVPLDLRASFELLAQGGRPKLGYFRYVSEKRIKLLHF